MFYYTMWHKGGLRESFETICQISEEAFRILTESGLYKRYSYDERIKATRYIVKDIEENLGMPTWLLESEIEQY